MQKRIFVRLNNTSLGTILHEIHKADCTCSYCRGMVHYGLNIPSNISFNSWFVLKYGKGKYIRMTFNFLKRFKRCSLL